MANEYNIAQAVFEKSSFHSYLTEAFFAAYENGPEKPSEAYDFVVEALEAGGVKPKGGPINPPQRGKERFKTYIERSGLKAELAEALYELNELFLKHNTLPEQPLDSWLTERLAQKKSHRFKHHHKERHQAKPHANPEAGIDGSPASPVQAEERAEEGSGKGDGGEEQEPSQEPDPGNGGDKPPSPVHGEEEPSEGDGQPEVRDEEEGEEGGENEGEPEGAGKEEPGEQGE